MWLRHFIEHLMCIGGELEHSNALPLPARKNRAVWSALLAGELVYIGTSLVPVRGMNRYQREARGPGSSHQPGPMVVGQERGPFVPVRPTNRDQRGQTNRDQCPHEARQAPGLTNQDQCPHWSRFWTEPGLMG